ncbi:MAG TPA: hypothetical protein VF666_00670 [Pyrinomonadaceae bacterium]|jgi:hypothetical protein
MLKDDTMRRRSNATPDEFVEQDVGDDPTAVAAHERNQATQDDEAENDEAEEEGDNASMDEDFERGRASALSRVYDTLPGSSRLWNLITLACLAAAAFAILNRRSDAAFVVATLGVLAWFVEKRNRLQAGSESVEPRGQIKDEDERNRVENE